MPSRSHISAGMIVLVFAAFVSIGLPDALFGVAWPSMKVEFNRTNAAVGLLNIPGALAYMGSSVMLGTIMRRLTLAQLLSGSTALVGLGLTLYAIAPTFWLVIPAVMLIAVGSGAIDAALNLFAAQNLPSRYMSWLHAFYGVGALAGPFVMAIVFNLGLAWRWGYASIAMILWLMALVFVLTHKQWRAAPENPEEDEPKEQESALTATQVLRMPRVQLTLLMMMGGSMAECLAALWIASIMIQRFAVSESRAAIAAGVFWVALTLARILVPVLWPTAKSVRTQRVSTYLVILAAIFMIPENLPLTVIGVVLIGLGIASVFPVAMTITADRFGPAVSVHAVGFMISGSTIMYAAMPPLSGWMADKFGFVSIPVLVLLGGLLLLSTQVMLVRGDPKPAT